MRFLLDENLSPILAKLLQTAGHDAVHVKDLGLTTAMDSAVLSRAQIEGRVLVPADTDFGELLARSGAVSPSVILFHRQSNRRALEQVESLLSNLDALTDDLKAGSVAVIESSRIRIRRLPLPGPAVRQTDG